MKAATTPAETAARLRSLVELAALPARRRAAELASRSDELRDRRDRAIAAVPRGFVAGFIASLPILGEATGRRAGAAREEVAAADAAWAAALGSARISLNVMKEAAEASKAVARLSARLAAADGYMPSAAASRLADMAGRVTFLEATDARDVARADSFARRAFALARVAGEIADRWEDLPPPPAPSANRPVESLGRGRGSQLGLDFDGTGQVEPEPRIWLPVSASRTKEMQALGASVDRSAPARGSRLWIPFRDRVKFEAHLPLAFRSEGVALSFPPIRHNAVGSNLWSVFDRPSWNRIRTAAYDRSGHRCQICGKQYGTLWARIASAEEKKNHGPVDCHEVWDWSVPGDAPRGFGIQKLRRLLCVCADCHCIFHEGFALSRARDAGLETQAADHIRKLRMLVNRVNGDALDAQVSADRVAWEATADIHTWILDLSHMAAQDLMQDHRLVLKSANRAGATPSTIGGIPFVTEDGAYFASQDASALARGEGAKPTSSPRANAV